MLDEVLLCSSVGVPAGQLLQPPPRLHQKNLRISSHTIYEYSLEVCCMTTLLRLVTTALQAVNLCMKLSISQLRVILNAMTQRWLAYVSPGNSVVDSTSLFL